MGDRTTIAVSKATRDELARLGRKDETYDDLVRRLMREAGWARAEARLPTPPR